MKMLFALLTLVSHAENLPAVKLSALSVTEVGSATIYQLPGVYLFNQLQFVLTGESDADAVCRGLGKTRRTSISMQKGWGDQSRPSAVTLDSAGQVRKTVGTIGNEVPYIESITCE